MNRKSPWILRKNRNKHMGYGSKYIKKDKLVNTQFCTYNLTLGDDQIIILGTQISWLHFIH